MKNFKFKTWFKCTYIPSKVSYLIVISWLVVLLCNSIKKFYFKEIDIFNLDKTEVFYLWTVNITEFAGLSIAAFLMIAYGIRSIRILGFSMPIILLLLLGLSLPVFSILYFKKFSNSLHNIVDNLKGARTVLSEKQLNKFRIKVKGKYVKEYFELSKLNAKMKYRFYGKRIAYEAPNGRAIYVPTTEDIELYDKLVKGIKLAEYQKVSFLRTSYIWGITLLSSLLLGFFTSTKKVNDSNP